MTNHEGLLSGDDENAWDEYVQGIPVDLTVHQSLMQPIHIIRRK